MEMFRTVYRYLIDRIDPDFYFEYFRLLPYHITCTGYGSKCDRRISTNPIVIALLIDLILLFLGCIMDMAPIILIATPILLPIATSIGIDPVQFGIIMVLNCGIGLLTPPVGSVLFIGSAVSGVKMERVVKATLPFYICMIIVLMLLTFIPEVSLLLPRVFGGYGG